MSDVYARTFSVGTAAVMIVSPHSQPQRVIVHDHTKNASRDLYIGGDDVSTSNGLHILQTESQEIMLPPGKGLFAIVNQNTVDTQVFVTRL